MGRVFVFSFCIHVACEACYLGLKGLLDRSMNLIFKKNYCFCFISYHLLTELVFNTWNKYVELNKYSLYNMPFRKLNLPLKI